MSAAWLIQVAWYYRSFTCSLLISSIYEWNELANFDSHVDVDVVDVDDDDDDKREHDSIGNDFIWYKLNFKCSSLLLVAPKGDEFFFFLPLVYRILKANRVSIYQLTQSDHLKDTIREREREKVYFGHFLLAKTNSRVSRLKLQKSYKLQEVYLYMLKYIETWYKLLYVEISLIG